MHVTSLAHATILTSAYDAGSWGNVNLLPVSAGFSSSHPTVACISDTNKLAFACCASSSTVNTIETLEVPINGSAIQTGDVNESGRMDIVDALDIAQYHVGLTSATFNRTVADVNCDTSITIVDALLVAQYYVGTIPKLPCP
ncbi:MAG: dockerin type I repeat-containing protein [Clostridiales bacterium]|nr:dockerin type I repeat-containing protein [Clostridiales bacterium]